MAAAHTLQPTGGQAALACMVAVEGQQQHRLLAAQAILVVVAVPPCSSRSSSLGVRQVQVEGLGCMVVAAWARALGRRMAWVVVVVVQWLTASNR